MTDLFKHKKAILILSTGEVFEGFGFGATGDYIGEVCFNTSMSGYQEILTDPSYTCQIITFTCPHIGNVGCNSEDMESGFYGAGGLITRDLPTPESNQRAEGSFNDWLKTRKVIGLAGIDTRALTQSIRDKGAPNGLIAFHEDGKYDLGALRTKLAQWPGLEGLDLASVVSTRKSYDWRQKLWHPDNGYEELKKPRFKVVAVDFGIKQNMLRHLASSGCVTTVVNAKTQASEILKMKPDGILLSNGPGDPAACCDYSTPLIQELLSSKIPLFGICLGHQLLGLALGGKTKKMHLGHRGGNHPVQNLLTGRVEITSQNHGFSVEATSIQEKAEITHVSLFDQTNEGLRTHDGRAFSVQYHPEASPGPHDAHYLFDQFTDLMAA